jgi:hypothetical protein
MYIHRFLIIFTNLWVDLGEEPETNNEKIWFAVQLFIIEYEEEEKTSFPLINRMPEIIEINKQLSYGKGKEKEKKRGVVNSSVSFSP